MTWPWQDRAVTQTTWPGLNVTWMIPARGTFANLTFQCSTFQIQQMHCFLIWQTSQQKPYALFSLLSNASQKRAFEGALALQDGFKVCLVCIEFGCLENKHACKSQILSRSCQNLGQIFWPPTLQWISMQLADPPAAWNTFRRQRNKIFRRNLQISQLLVELPHVAGKGGGLLNEKQQLAVIVVKSH